MESNLKKRSVTSQDCTKIIEDFGIENVRCEFYDMNSVARSKTVPARHFQNCVTSGILVPLSLFTIDTQGNAVFDNELRDRYLYSDMVCYPDLTTFTILPWVKDTARVFLSASVAGEGDLLTIDPRNIAQAQLKTLREREISLLSSFEYEFWVVQGKTRKTINDGWNICSTLRLAKHEELFSNIAKNLYKIGIDVEYIQTEYAPGQFEMPFKPSFGIRAADNAATFRTGIKEMVLQQGFEASFMTKLFKTQEGCSGHLNHSLWSLDRQTSLLCDTSRPYGLSKMGEHWIAGLLAHAPALSLLQSPTLNCRNYFRPDTFAPFNATWGVDNRTCAVRLKKRGEHGVYVENRLGSSAGNPYISLAATIAAGIDGIDRKLPLPKDIPFNKPASDEDSIPPDTLLLPTDVDGALKSLTEDTVLCEAFGSDFIQAFKSIKLHEKKLLWSNCRDEVNDAYKWFREFYFEYI